MVVAKVGFSYAVGKDGRFHQDGKIKYFRVGDLIPDTLVPRLAYMNPEYIEGCYDQKKRKEIVDKALGITNKLIKEKKIEPKKPRYTKEELKAWTKAEQVEALQKLGITGPEITKLRLESMRVDKLYQLYQEEL